MTQYLLDTNVLIDWIANGSSQKFISQLLEDPKTELGLAWLTIVEFCVKATKREQKYLFDSISSGDITVYELTGLDLAQKTAAIRQKTALKLPDCFILTTAMEYKLLLLTMDKGLIQKGLSVYKWMMKPE